MILESLIRDKKTSEGKFVESNHFVSRFWCDLSSWKYLVVEHIPLNGILSYIFHSSYSFQDTFTYLSSRCLTTSLWQENDEKRDDWQEVLYNRSLDDQSILKKKRKSRGRKSCSRSRKIQFILEVFCSPRGQNTCSTEKSRLFKKKCRKQSKEKRFLKLTHFSFQIVLPL